MKISVVICTYNREKMISLCLESLVRQNFSKDEYEILVIDNNSTDNTKFIVEEFIKKYSNFNIKYIFEPRQGLSIARNSGLNEAKGEVVVYIDDDAIADNNLLLEHYKTYSIDKKIACVGGKINVKFQDLRPKWLTNDFLGVYGYFNPSDKVSETKEVYGGNFSIKKEIIQSLSIYFDKNLGRIADKLTSGEESLFCEELLKMKYKIFYNPNAVVYHLVTTERMNKKYLRQLAKTSSLSNVYIKKKDDKALISYILNSVFYLIISIIAFIKDLLLLRLYRFFYNEFRIRKLLFTIIYGFKELIMDNKYDQTKYNQ